MENNVIETFIRRTTLRQIEVMVTLQKYNSMSKAADALGMSVANVSRMSKRFENNLGVQLFVGDKRRSILLKDAHEIIDCLAPVNIEIDRLKIALRHARD